jgi:hypothetical protein
MFPALGFHDRSSCGGERVGPGLDLRLLGHLRGFAFSPISTSCRMASEREMG